MKTLVVYFSRKGYTEKVAKKIAEKNKADIYEVKSTQKTKGILGFWWCGRFGMHRWKMPIEPISINVSEYDKVIICSPIWVFTVSAPIYAFISSCEGKIKEVEYVLLHFSFSMKYDKTLRKMDSILGINHKKFTSIVCIWGKLYSADKKA